MRILTDNLLTAEEVKQVFLLMLQWLRIAG